MTTQRDKERAQLERLTQRASVAMARRDVLLARQRTREKSQEATRHYRLGLVLEGFLFDDAVLLGRVRECIERESPRVRAAFGLEETASWFERPERVDSKTVVDTRRFRLGMVLERLLPEDAALIARVEALVREQPTHVRDAFGLDGELPSWFDSRRQDVAPSPRKPPWPANTAEGEAGARPGQRRAR